MTMTILDLPSELIENIFTFLPNEDVFATRQANSQLERASLSHFRHRFFRKKGYMLTSPSLCILQQIASHAELRKYVQHVWFNPDCFSFVHPECAPDPQETRDPENPDSLLDLLSPSDRRQYLAYRECMDDHFSLTLRSATKLRDVLATAFADLPNLETIGMRRSEDHRPWGWSKLRDAVGEDPRVLGPIPRGHMYALSSPTRLFDAIVSALATTGVKLKRLYTDAIEIDHIRPDMLTQDTLDKACGSISYLEINVTKANLGTKKHADYVRLWEARDQYGDGLVRLLKATSHLKELGLQIFPDRQQSHMIPPDYFGDPESWRRSYAYLCLAKMNSYVRLEHLTRVKLEKVTASPALLLGFLSPSQECLSSLKLRDIRLLSDVDYPRPWQPIFEFLRDSCQQLEYILLYHLMYEAGGVSFIEDPPLPPPPSGSDTTTGAPTGPYGGSAGSELFTKYEHIGLELRGREIVHAKLAEVVEQHWYQRPITSYQMDDSLWHTDTSDEEW